MRTARLDAKKLLCGGTRYKRQAVMWWKTRQATLLHISSLTLQIVSGCNDEILNLSLVLIINFSSKLQFSTQLSFGAKDEYMYGYDLFKLLSFLISAFVKFMLYSMLKYASFLVDDCSVGEWYSNRELVHRHQRHRTHEAAAIH